VSGLALVDGNAGAGNGGAINSLESLSVKNCILTSNIATKGGGIYMKSTVENKVLISGSVISGNNATSGFGGGLYLDTGKGITILNTTVSGNTATNSGGGAYLKLNNGFANSAKIVIIGSVFRRNVSGNSGGGLAARLTDHAMLISKTQITGNISDDFGGGLYTYRGRVTMVGSTVAGNRVTGGTNDGGGIYSSDSQMTLTATRVIGNSAAGDGGGILHNGSNHADKFLKVTGGTISGNTAGATGGGIHGLQGGKITLKGTSVQLNQAVGNGGGINTTGTGASKVDLEIVGGVYEGKAEQVIFCKRGECQTEGGMD
jgi:parallel beta-helix repeat protein